MEIDIAKTTDKEIQDIIDRLVSIGYEQVDQGYVEKTSHSLPEAIYNTLGLALYPELLSYRNEKEWVTIPWICIKAEVECIDEARQREFVRWMVEELKSAGYSPFKDEDSFAGFSKRDQRKGYVKLKFYVNPSFPQGYWSNHTL